MKVSDMFPTSYVSGADLKGKAFRVTIARVEAEELRPVRNAPPETKYVVYVEQSKKGVILSRTLAVQIAAIVGSDETRDWVGKSITIYPEPMTVAGKPRIAIRARKPGPEPRRVPASEDDDESTGT
jgi:hypothetical protein